MAKGYSTEEIKKKLVEILKESKTGFSGSEISEKIGINRVTITKYLNIFAAEGLIRQKNAGNMKIWFVEEGTEQVSFPDDYFKIKTKYQEYLVQGSDNQIYSLVRNCIHSDASVPKMITEVIFPAIEFVQKLYQQGKIGKSEEKFLDKIISSSIQILNLINTVPDPQKNVIIISADPENALLAEASSASFHSEGWNVSLLGDMSDVIDVLFDLDLQKFLSKVWKQQTGIMIIVVFSQTVEGSKFFSEAINSLKAKYGKNFHLALCSRAAKKTSSSSSTKAELITPNFEEIFQWSQTTFESSVSHS